MSARKTTHTHTQNDYIQNGYLNVDSVLRQKRPGGRGVYLRFLRIRYMRPLMKVNAKATHARMKE